MEGSLVRNPLLRQAMHPDPRALPSPRRLSGPVIQKFVDEIVSGSLPPGSPLPPEAALCEHFDVSRTVIREVLKVLEQKGLVRVHNGKGTWTTDTDSWNLLDPLVLAARMQHDRELNFLPYLITVRMALEGEMAAQAAAVATEAQIRDMGDILAQLARSMDDIDRYVRLDYAFHNALMGSSGNELGRAIVLAILQPSHAYARYGTPTLEHVRQSQPGHKAIFEAVRRRDSRAARRAARNHIAGGMEIVPGSAG
ncbi:MAG TPA: FCD domain-containing protein [Acidimicrobiales bacterium]|nr:FCD domain-containing protein [Acidimicrobiales bacterium]